MAFIPTEGLRYAVQPDVVQVASISPMPLITRLSQKGQTALSKQRQIRWNVSTAFGGVSAQASTADISSQANDTLVTAVLPIGDARLSRSFVIQNNEMVEAANIGVGELADLLAFEVNSAIEAIMQELSERLYVAGSNSGISAGLADLHATSASNKSTVVYAGLDPATHPRWTNLVYDNGGTARALTVALLRSVLADMRSGATIGTAVAPTALYMNPVTANAYKALFDTRVLPQYGKGVADVSYSTLMFEGIEIVEDPYCPVGAVYFINESALKLYSFDHSTSADAMEVGEQPSNLSFLVKSLPSNNPEGQKFAVLINPQLQVRNRAAVAALIDLL